MSKPTMTILIGPPRTGKTTRARELIAAGARGFLATFPPPGTTGAIVLDDPPLTPSRLEYWSRTHNIQIVGMWEVYP